MVFEPLRPIPASWRVGLGALAFAVLLALWAAATFGGWVRPLFLADPVRTFLAGGRHHPRTKLPDDFLPLMDVVLHSSDV